MTIDAGAQEASPVALALQQALVQWRGGTADAVAYDLPLAAARSSYAHPAGVDPSAVAWGVRRA